MTLCTFFTALISSAVIHHNAQGGSLRKSTNLNSRLTFLKAEHWHNIGIMLYYYYIML